MGWWHMPIYKKKYRYAFYGLYDNKIPSISFSAPCCVSFSNTAKRGSPKNFPSFHGWFLPSKMSDTKLWPNLKKNFWKSTIFHTLSSLVPFSRDFKKKYKNETTCRLRLKTRSGLKGLHWGGIGNLVWVPGWIFAAFEVTKMPEATRGKRCFEAPPSRSFSFPASKSVMALW